MIGIGTDLVELDRFRASIERTPALVDRLFTDGERHYAEAATDPTERYAARFAAKEATFKALGIGVNSVGVDRRWQEAEVVREDGPPRLTLHGSVAAAAARRRVLHSALSISHDGPGAIASVILSVAGDDA